MKRGGIEGPVLHGELYKASRNWSERFKSSHERGWCSIKALFSRAAKGLISQQTSVTLVGRTLHQACSFDTLH